MFPVGYSAVKFVLILFWPTILKLWSNMKGKIDLYNGRFKRSKMCKIISKCLKLYITLKNMIFLKKWFLPQTQMFYSLALQPDGVTVIGNLWNFKLRLFDTTEFIVWNI